MDLGIRRTNGSLGAVAVALEPISFQIRTQDSIRQQRDHVAFIAGDLEPDAETPVLCAVISRPSEPNRRLYEESRELLSDFGVRILIVDQIEPLKAILAKSGIRID